MATVAVLQGRYRFLRINGKTDAGDSPDNLTQRLLAHVPMLLHPQPRSVLIVGLGTGITAGTVLVYPIDRADLVEISAEVVEASHFFDLANGRPLDDRRTRLYLLDARTWMLAAKQQYDVIVSEPSNPWQTGNANLFTLDHYRATWERLAPGGIFCQWLPFYRMDERDFQAAIRTLHTVFPAVTAWVSGGDVLLVAAKMPAGAPGTSWRFDLSRLMERAAAAPIAQSLRTVGIRSGAAFFGFFLLDPERVREYAGDGLSLHTDDYPILEFSAPRTLYRESAPQILNHLRQLAARSALPLTSKDVSTTATVYDEIARRRLGMLMPDAALAAVDQAVRLGGATPERRELQAAAWHDIGIARRRQGDMRGARQALEQALALMPDFPEARVALGVTIAEGFGDLARAEREVREALRLRPAYREALIGLARILESQGRHAAAELAWSQVLMADPANAEARQSLATLRRPAR
jgi:tetratricopeptide (TPR) repeat protein